jgi:hypothetical protein
MFKDLLAISVATIIGFGFFFLFPFFGLVVIMIVLAELLIHLSKKTLKLVH